MAAYLLRTLWKFWCSGWISGTACGTELSTQVGLERDFSVWRAYTIILCNFSHSCASQSLSVALQESSCWTVPIMQLHAHNYLLSVTQRLAFWRFLPRVFFFFTLVKEDFFFYCLNSSNLEFVESLLQSKCNVDVPHCR